MREGINFYLKDQFPEVEIKILKNPTDINVAQLKDELIITHGHPYVVGFKKLDLEHLRTNLPEKCKLIVYSEINIPISTDLCTFILWTQKDAMETLLKEVGSISKN